MAERFFTQIANEVLEATERIVSHFDDNLNLLFGDHNNSNSDATTTTPNTDSTGSSTQKDDFQIFDDEYISQLDEDAMRNPLQGMADQVLGGIMDGQYQLQTTMESFHAFRSAITWTEPFIVGVLLFHLTMFLLTVYVSRYNSNLIPRLIVMSIIAITVRTSEYMNTYASQYWESWGITQNYFDPKGVFTTIMICSPLLINSFIMLVCFLREASTLLIQVKRVQLQKQHRRKQEKNTNTTATKKDL